MVRGGQHCHGWVSKVTANRPLMSDVSRLGSLLYRVLAATAQFRSIRGIRRVWQAAWSRGCRHYDKPVTVRVHGREICLNFGHPYPLIERSTPLYNAPLVELVAAVYAETSAPVCVVDVGAGIGDTVLLLQERCAGKLGQIFAIEGEHSFFGLLQRNVSDLPGVRLHNVFLSDTVGHERALVRSQHAGTASAQGNALSCATTLDDLLRSTSGIDVIKIDTDGLDGKVLAGSRQSLERDRPGVIFEWHPIACRATGSDYLLPFRVLAQSKYNEYIFFTKYGGFSHFMRGVDEATLRQLADFCLSSTTMDDWHYDVIALPRETRLSPVRLADLEHFRSSERRR